MAHVWSSQTRPYKPVLACVPGLSAHTSLLCLLSCMHVASSSHLCPHSYEPEHAHRSLPTQHAPEPLLGDQSVGATCMRQVGVSAKLPQCQSRTLGKLSNSHSQHSARCHGHGTLPPPQSIPESGNLAGTTEGTEPQIQQNPQRCDRGCPWPQLAHPNTSPPEACLHPQETMSDPVSPGLPTSPPASSNAGSSERK